MDKRNAYPRVKAMLEEHKGKALNLDELTALIMINLGSTPATVASHLRIMALTGLVKDIGNSRFEVL